MKTIKCPTCNGKGKIPALIVPKGIPADNVEFTLTLNPVAAMDMVRGDGYDPANWKFKGQGIAQPQTGRFKLVRVGYCRNLDEVRQKLGAGNVPEGQWSKAFKAAFPANDGNGPIGFADASWAGPVGGAGFPVLCVRGGAWRSAFVWAGDARGARWRWLVACK